jgi:hypothetical protein
MQIALDQFWQIPATQEGRFNIADPASIYGSVRGKGN